jgi:hypothetical protein
MLEILFVIYLCKQLGNVLRNKGRAPGWYQAMLVAFWIVGEIMGGIIAMVITGGEFTALAYLGALVGAGAGAGLAFFVAHQATPAQQMSPRGFAVMPYPSQRDPGEI